MDKNKTVPAAAHALGTFAEIHTFLHKSALRGSDLGVMNSFVPPPHLHILLLPQAFSGL